jgi:restriction endonuclease S subunit
MDREVTGGTRPALDYSAIKKLLILYPKELETQEEIAKLVYKIVDDAYSKLERRNKILSELDEIVLEKLGIELPEEYAKKCFEVNPYFETIS